MYLFRILSFASELFLFIYAGVTMWSITLWHDSEEFTKVRGGLWPAGRESGAGRCDEWLACRRAGAACVLHSLHASLLTASSDHC